MITNKTILRDYKRRLLEVVRDMRGTKDPHQLAKMQEYRKNLIASIIDLQGAIKAGADDQNPLAGWC